MTTGLNCFHFIPKREFLLLTFTDLQLLTKTMWMFLLNNNNNNATKALLRNHKHFPQLNKKNNY